MTTPAPWTVPPGMRISDGAGGSKDPLAGLLVTPPIEISSAELLDLHNTSKVLMPGVPGQWLRPIWALFVFTPGNVNYDPEDNGSTFNIRCGGVNTNITPTMAAVYNFFNPGQVSCALSFAGALTFGPDQRGQPLVLDQDQAVHDGNGTLTVTVAYLGV